MSLQRAPLETGSKPVINFVMSFSGNLCPTAALSNGHGGARARSTPLGFNKVRGPIVTEGIIISVAKQRAF